MWDARVSASVYEWRGLHRPGGVSVSSRSPGSRMRGQEVIMKRSHHLTLLHFRLGSALPLVSTGENVSRKTRVNVVLDFTEPRVSLARCGGNINRSFNQIERLK